MSTGDVGDRSEARRSDVFVGLVDDHGDETRAEVEGSVDAEERTRRTAITCMDEPLRASELIAASCVYSTTIDQ